MLSAKCVSFRKYNKLPACPKLSEGGIRNPFLLNSRFPPSHKATMDKSREWQGIMTIYFSSPQLLD